MMLRDGMKVAYVGHPADGLDIGDEGVVMQAGSTGSHVKWRTGGRRDQIELVANDELVAHNDAAESLVSDSLEGGLGLDVQSAYERKGVVGVLNKLAEEGHCAAFETYAEEAMRLMATRIRQDPSFVEVLASLEPEDGEALVDHAMRTLVRDAFGDS